MKRILALSLSFVVLFAFPGCTRDTDQPFKGAVKKISVAVTSWPASASVFVAQEKGFFKNEGLEVTIRPNESGHLAIAPLLAGDVEFATMGETPFVRAALEQKPMAIVASLAEIERAIQIIGRKDRGISRAEDLKGKTIGVIQGTTADFFLHIFLTSAYLGPKDVRVVNLAPGRIVDALLSGEVDAVSTWAPYTTILKEKLGRDSSVLDEPGLYRMTWNLVVRKDLAQRDPECIVRFLHALVKANRYIAEDPAGARNVVSRYLKTDASSLQREWADCRMTATLAQSLVVNLEDQSRWMIGRGIVRAGRVPNVLDFIYVAALKDVQPGAVSIIKKSE